MVVLLLLVHQPHDELQVDPLLLYLCQQREARQHEARQVDCHQQPQLADQLRDLLLHEEVVVQIPVPIGVQTDKHLVQRVLLQKTIAQLVVVLPVLVCVLMDYKSVFRILTVLELEVYVKRSV